MCGRNTHECDPARRKVPGTGRLDRGNPEEAAAFIATIPAGRIGECEEDIGEFVAFRCSDSARYVSGQSLVIDSGQA